MAIPVAIPIAVATATGKRPRALLMLPISADREGREPSE